jgi:hypothetical protein
MPSKLVSLAVALYVADVHCGGTAESIFPPILTELILSLAGFLTAQNRFSFPLVFIAATLASLLGALLLYGIGMAAGQRGVGGCSTLWALAPAHSGRPLRIEEPDRSPRPGRRLHRSSRPHGAVGGLDSLLATGGGTSANFS